MLNGTANSDLAVFFLPPQYFEINIVLVLTVNLENSFKTGSLFFNLPKSKIINSTFD